MQNHLPMNTFHRTLFHLMNYVDRSALVPMHPLLQHLPQDFYSPPVAYLE